VADLADGDGFIISASEMIDVENSVTACSRSARRGCRRLRPAGRPVQGGRWLKHVTVPFGEGGGVPPRDFLSRATECSSKQNKLEILSFVHLAKNLKGSFVCDCDEETSLP